MTDVCDRHTLNFLPYLYKQEATSFSLSLSWMMKQNDRRFFSNLLSNFFNMVTGGCENFSRKESYFSLNQLILMAQFFTRGISSTIQKKQYFCANGTPYFLVFLAFFSNQFCYVIFRVRVFIPVFYCYLNLHFGVLFVYFLQFWNICVNLRFYCVNAIKTQINAIRKFSLICVKLC